jgi:hypothetical protein
LKASETFYNAQTTVGRGSEAKQSEALKLVTSPEIKRRIIGDTFINVTEAVSSLLCIHLTSCHNKMMHCGGTGNDEIDNRGMGS